MGKKVNTYMQWLEKMVGRYTPWYPFFKFGARIRVQRYVYTFSELETHCRLLSVLSFKYMYIIPRIRSMRTNMYLVTLD